MSNGHGGYEYKRSGGSAGKTHYNHDLLRWMHSSKNFPRKGKGVKLIKGENKWHCFYIGARGRDRKAVHWKGYCQPKRGGSFFMPEKIIQNYKCIQAFIKAKIDT